jgi:hypothetical protein
MGPFPTTPRTSSRAARRKITARPGGAARRMPALAVSAPTEAASGGVGVQAIAVIPLQVLSTLTSLRFPPCP